MYAESAKDYDVERDSFIYCAVNAYWEEQTFELPIIPEGMQWRIVEYTADDKDKFDGQPVDGKVKLIGRSVMIIIAQ